MARVALMVVLATLIAGCRSTPEVTPANGTDAIPGSSAPTLPPQIKLDDLREWTTFREFWGLRSDEQWAVAVALDPAATVDMDVPLLPWERDQILQLDRSAQALVARLEGYGSRYPEDFAGVYIEGRMVVVRFAHNLDAHRAVIGPRFEEFARVQVEQAAYSLPELERFAQQVAARRSVIDALGVTLYSADVDVVDNAVRVRYQGSHDLEGELRTLLGDPDWLQLEHYDVSG